MTTQSLETAIHKELGRVYLCTLEELTALLPHFSASQVAATVERLTREGAIACRSSESSRSILWLPPTRSRSRSLEEPMAGGPPEPDHEELELEAWTESTSGS